MHTRVQIASIVFALLVFAAVFELVRRRYLRERYAILWLGAALVLLVLAVWKNLLTTVSKAIGIYYPPNAFFVIAFAFLLLLLLHFSAVVSRLADETRVLAQRLALQEGHSRQQPADARADETPLTGGDREPFGDREALAGGDPEPLASGDREPGQLAARGWSPRRSSG